MTHRTLVLCALVALPLIPAAFAGSTPEPGPRIATIPIPGDKRLVRIARDIIEARVALNPDLASSIGLFDDAIVVPSYTPEAVKKQDARLARDLAALDKLPWRTWDIDQQIDARWLQANAEDARHKLTGELRVGISTDAGIVPDPEALVASLEAELGLGPANSGVLRPPAPAGSPVHA